MQFGQLRKVYIMNISIHAYKARLFGEATASPIHWAV